ncbi:MAG TPA: polyprenyl synthetase family protein [Saprospiraceae bacterium]|nr:polyprenyl synthetase family protein [Saprospiraceae bacterium]HNT20612.1 polyprenyl synthetase family protein [Saprospiraceae bacterium]
MLYVEQLLTLFEAYRKDHPFRGPVPELYEPARYLMELGGKRLRPVFTLAVHQLFRNQLNEALPAALAIEVFHNFSLMHDDIMDQSPLRRGKPTVHSKYNINAAILSGDWMLIHTYEILNQYKSKLAQSIIRLMNETAIKICEGQQRDINFETRTTIKKEEYLDMIRDKTAVLLAAAARMGAMTAGASEEDQKHLYHMGLNAGLAFQLMDDYLDAFGDQTGKMNGGDILQNKKTLLFIKTLEKANDEDRKALLDLYEGREEDKVPKVLELFTRYGAGDKLKALSQEYNQKASDALAAVEASSSRKEILNSLLTELLKRNI